MKQERKQYINNDEFTAELMKCKQEDKVSNKLVSYFYLLIKKINARNYQKNYDEAMDFEQYSIEQLLKMWKKYDISRGNAFSFFTGQISFSVMAAYNKLHPKDVTIISTSYIDDSGTIKDAYNV